MVGAVSEAQRLSGRSGPRCVLMTTDAVGGVWSYALELARGLARAGSRVILAAMGPPPSDAQRAEVKAIRGLSLEEGPFKLEWMDDCWSDVDAAGAWLLALESRHRPDVIHLNGFAHGGLAFGAPKIVVAHSCVYSWWNAVRGGSPPAGWSDYRRRVRAGIAGADALIAPSRWMLRSVRRHYGLPGSAQVIANGRDPAAFPIGPKEPFVLCAGRLWDPAKNVAALSRAASRLPWPVVMAGDDRPVEGQAAGAGGEPLDENVRLAGRLSAPRMADAYGRASIYASPARYEPFGLSALEAALAGCALVLGDIPSLREIWQDGALFVDPDDDAALVDGLCALIHDPFARGAAASRARRRALRFSTERMCAAYLELYWALAVRGAADPSHDRANDRAHDDAHERASERASNRDSGDASGGAFESAQGGAACAS